MKRFFVSRYFDEDIFEGGAGLCRNNGRVQSIFDEKPHSSTMASLLWLLVKIVTWWGDFTQITTCGIRSDSSL